MFLVLSGFLLAHVMLGELQRGVGPHQAAHASAPRAVRWLDAWRVFRTAYGRFLWRRVARVYPSLLVAVLLVQGTLVDAASGVAFELDLSPRVFRAPRAADAGAAASPLLVSCRGAEARAVAELLLACRDLPARAAPATELSKEAMARVREKVKEAPLPEGIFYDGRGYIDGFGDWTADQHPALEAAVEAEMRALNAEAERCSAALATQHAAAQAEAAAYLGRVQGSIEVD